MVPGKKARGFGGHHCVVASACVCFCGLCVLIVVVVSLCRLRRKPLGRSGGSISAIRRTEIREPSCVEGAFASPRGPCFGVKTSQSTVHACSVECESLRRVGAQVVPVSHDTVHWFLIVALVVVRQAPSLRAECTFSLSSCVGVV